MQALIYKIPYFFNPVLCTERQREKSLKNAKKNELERIKKKLNELDSRLNQLRDYSFPRIRALIHLLQDKGVFTIEEMMEYIFRHKKSLKKFSEEIQFLLMIKQLRRKRKTG